MDYLSSDMLQCIEPDFKIDTAAEAFSSTVEKANNWIGALAQCIDFVPDDPDASVVITSAQIKQIFNDAGLSDDTCLACQDGFTTLQSTYESIAQGLTDYASGEIESLDDVLLSVTLADESADSDVGLLTFADQVKNDIASAICAKSALLASKYESVSDRLQKFEADVSAYIDTQYSGFNTAVSYYKSLVSSKLDGQGVLNTLFNAFGVTRLNNTEPIALKDMDVSAYTGANPLGSLSFGCVKTAAVSVGKIVGAAGVAIWNGVKSIGKWLWNKAKKYTVEVFSNPYDVKCNGDSKLGPCFSGFQYQYTTASGYFDVPIDDTITPAELLNYLNDHSNKWYVMKTLGGEMAIKWEAVGSVTQSSTYRTVTYTNMTMVFKPYALARDVLPTATPEQYFPGQRYRGSLATVTNALANRAGGSYLDTDASEVDLANAFLNGFGFTAASIHKMVEQYAGTAVNDYLDYEIGAFTAGATITNADWLTIACGYNSETGRFDTLPVQCKVYDEKTGSFIYSDALQYVIKDFFCVIALTIGKNALVTSNFSNYVPYTVDATEMSMGRFEIKTDAENQAVANALMTAFVAVVIVVAVVITGVVIAKKVSRKLFWKRTEFIAKSDNAMWSGKSLSPSDRRKYLRYKRKLDGVSAISAGTVGSSISEAIKQVDLSTPAAILCGGAIDSSGNIPTLNSLTTKVEDTSGQVKRILRKY